MNELSSEALGTMHRATQQTEYSGSTSGDDIYKNGFELHRQLPHDLRQLDEISRNYAWSWLPNGVDLFRDLDAALWEECEQNPRLFLARISELRLWQRAVDSIYVERLNKFDAALTHYISTEPKTFGQVSKANPVAYFCAEYGVHNSLPNYSGGLGILAGDHLKSASDLSVPLVAIGLLYRFGYFRQSISHEGWQEETYHDVFRSELAVTPVTDADGKRITVAVHIRGREVAAQAWLARVGRIPLYLLDTNLEVNSETDRMITGHLYGGDIETRIVQEKVLGIGGVRFLRKMGISPSVYHLNEGHSAFLTLELAREFLEKEPDRTFDEVRETVRELCVFTTHTPVAAGNDTFDPAAVQACFSSEYLDSLKISRDKFFDLGRTNTQDDAEYFGMTPLALRMCRSANGVSKKHGEVSRGLWIKMFPGLASSAEVSISHVTNGVHPSTWIAPAFCDVFDRNIGENWREFIGDAFEWKSAIDAIPDAEIWNTHRKLKQLLIAFVRERTRSRETGSKDTINERRDTTNLFSADALTIGFARRVAAYKRWNLLVSDLPRLLRLVDNPEKPVQFVFAGKAHPQDRIAKQILRDLMSINHDSNWQRRAVFIEDYDQEVARYLVQGVDVWLNVPRRPHEASGTSGMKAAMNGALNFSILDGWWIEGYNGYNGFAIGGHGPEGDSPEIDAADAEALYSILEKEIIPAFHTLGSDGLPAEWIGRMKNSMATLTPMFSSNRMVDDYVHNIYKQDAVVRGAD